MMSDDRKTIPLVELVGDGISLEITREARRVLDVFSTAPNGKYRFTWEQHPIGGQAIDQTGSPLPDSTLTACKRSAAVLLGAVGDPKYSSPDTPVRPEQGLLKIRSELQLFTNLRPVFVYPTLIDSSPFKRSTIEGTDMMIVRELTGGIYNNVHTLTEKDATDVMYYTVEEIERIVRVAARLAQQRKKKLVSLDKCNVLACSRLWRSVCTRVMKQEFPDVQVEHLLIDAAAMHILKRPRDFDVIVTENLFGDILTDEAAALSSSLGMLGSASMGHPNTPGLFEPIHGSAPDIAGKGIANPIGTILAASMMLRYGLGLHAEADLVDKAIAEVVQEGIVTGDVALPGAKSYSTTQVGIAIAHKVAAALHPVRPMTLPEKILCHQAVGLTKAEVKPGDVIVVKVARTLASEMTWVGMSQTYADIGKPQLWRKDRFFLAIDHTVDPSNYHEEKQKQLIDAAEGFAKSIHLDDYFGPNESILHTEFYRQKAMPGTVIVGADSHSCSAGCLGNFAAGLGAADVVMPVVTGQTFFEVPETLLIKFINDLPFGMTGKDVMLYIMQKLKRNTVAFERAVEFAGNIRSLSVDARFALSNMATEFGAIAGIFPSDEQTASFLAGRKKKPEISVDDDNEWDYKNFRGDEAAHYADAYDIDLSDVVPLIAKYPSPDNVYPIDHPEIDAIVPEVGRSIRKLDGCFIGACTTTEEELILAALVLEACMADGLTPSAPGTRKVTPGSTQITQKLERTGMLDIYRRAGYTVGAPGCSYCLGVAADVAPRNTVWLSSQNRNFRNRMGAGSIGNLASAATVAVSSFNMIITDPRPYLSKIDRKRFQTILERHPIPASVPVHQPSPQLEEAKGTTLPLTTQSSEKTESRFSKPITGRIQRFEDNIDTDAIIPGPLMLERPLKRLGTFSFKYVKPDFVDRVNAGQNIVVAGVGFGSGSSREEAVSCLRACGVQAVIAKSYAFIFGRNLLTLDLLGIVIKDERFYQLAQEDISITIDVPGRYVRIGDETFSFTMSDIQQQIYERNGIIEMYKHSGKNVFQELAAYAKQREGGEGCGSGGGCGSKDSGKGKPKTPLPAGATISW